MAVPLKVNLYESWSTIKHKAEPHIHVWMFLIGICAIGLLFGGAVAGQLNQSDVSVLSASVNNLLNAISHHQLASPSDLWWQRVTGDLQVLGLLWLFGVSVIGLPFVAVVLFLRSFSVGFAVGFTVIQFGWKGLVLAGLGIFTHQLISILVLLVAGVMAVRFSSRILQKTESLTTLSIRFLGYTGLYVLCAAGLMVSAGLQAFVMPHLLSAVLIGK
ncbi:stage II sporulation protein M [Alicyclobacillus sp. SO9]|uniref:stage II sporulation protein M n=1 Tax=Alicyclobacillus sp. SO9 TaxID=2665646 RepID=UPI001E521BA5|nr:stage II sporulation protein M [Alicyclobacillus sp. SO9]